MANQRLDDLGEMGILSGIVFPALARSLSGAVGIGDDCAIIEFPSDISEPVLLATADPCPTPVVFELFDSDYWHYGWLTAVINLSDLAAMGATPDSLLVSTVMPDGMFAAQYERFWAGLVAAADTWRCKIVGGNIKDGRSFSSDATALGWCSRSEILRRTGCREGDLIYAIGDLGIFWSAVLHRARVPDLKLSRDEEKMAVRALTRPQPRLREGRMLAQSHVVTACMDASDGVLGSLMELGRRNGMDVYLDMSPWRPRPLVRRVAAAVGIDIVKLMLAWGDWQLVVTVPPSDAAKVEGLMSKLRVRATLLGRMSAGAGDVWLKHADGWRQLANLSSERFSSRSYFVSGMASYLDWFVSAPVFVDEGLPGS